MAADVTVLVVESNQTLRTLLRRVLERLGHRVLLAADGRSALAVFDHYEDRIDLVVSELQLPRMRGSELACALRECQPDIAILLVGDGFPETAGEFPELEKPYSLERLEQRMKEVLEASRGGPPARIRVSA